MSVQPMPEGVRSRVLRRDHSQCQYCGRVLEGQSVTFDHLVPRAQGGPDTPGNLVVACRACNERKGNRVPLEVGMPLLTPKRLREMRERQTGGQG